MDVLNMGYWENNKAINKNVHQKMKNQCIREKGYELESEGHIEKRANRKLKI